MSVVGLPVAKRGIRAISLPVWILVGAIAGIAAGVALGDRTQVLQPFGDAYARMLEMAVYPYILCSLLYGLGRLTPKTAWRLLSTGWCTYVFLWVVTLGSIWLLSLAVPPAPIPSVITPQILRPQSDFLALLIPDNLIDSLGRNYVPAVVVFAIFYGIAFQKVERKDSIFQVLQTVQVASVTIWSWIVRVAPVGVFALMATAAGTVQPDRLAGLLLYLGLFLIGTILLAFVVLPMALIAIVPISYRELMKEMQPALVLALVTTLSVVALPFIMKAAERITARAGCPEDDERADILQANLSVSYVLAQLGNYFVYLLMLYAAYAYRLRLTGSQQLLLPFWTLMSGFGSPTATVDGVKFLASWLGLPPDVLNLFLETWPATRYGQVALSVVGIGFANILVPLVYFHQLRLRPMRAVATGCVAAASIGIVVLGGIFLGSLIAPTADNPRLAFTLDPQLIAGIQAKVQRGVPDGGQDAESVQGVTVRDIQNSGVLRVGYNPGVMPFSYWNNRGDLVGYDISFAYELARDLNVRLEFIPFTWSALAQDLLRRRFDIAMSGIYVSDERLPVLTASNFYYRSPIALIVRSDQADRFLSRGAVLAMPALRLVTPDDPILVATAHRLFPNATIRTIPDYSELPSMAGQFDGAIWTLQRASAWAAAHPGYTAVEPADMGGPLLFAYLMPPGSDDFRDFLDQWLDFHAVNGFRAAQVDYWINGLPRAHENQPRWNLFDALVGSSIR